MPQQSASTYIHDDYFILSPNFISQPSEHRQSVLTTTHDSNFDQDSQSVCSLRTTQSERTVDTNASNPAEDLTTTGYTFRPIFPPIFYNETTHLKMNPTQRLPFAQYPPSHFTPEEWDEIWNQPAIDLDPYLTLTMYPGGTFPTVFHHELEFMGYAYHVNFDADWVKISAQWMKKISFTRGTAVNVHNINNCGGQYIVEYCQLIRNGIAYLPVHFREYHDQGFSTTNDPRHHSFILAVPVELCYSPFLPHLRPSSTDYDTIRVTPSNTFSIPTLQLARVSARRSKPKSEWGQHIFKFKSNFCC